MSGLIETQSSIKLESASLAEVLKHVVCQSFLPQLISFDSLSRSTLISSPQSVAIYTQLFTTPAQMKLSAMLSMGVALLPEIVSADGGFFQSCRDNVSVVSFLRFSSGVDMMLFYGNSGVWKTTS